MYRAQAYLKQVRTPCIIRLHAIRKELIDKHRRQFWYNIQLTMYRNMDKPKTLSRNLEETTDNATLCNTKQ